MAYKGFLQSKMEMARESPIGISTTNTMISELEQLEAEVPRQRLTISILPGEPSDEELMARIQGRDERALAVLIGRYRKMLRSIVGNILANDQDVSDAIEEAFLGIWEHSANYDSTKGRAIAWIVTMARRRAIDRVRRRQAYDRAEMRYRLSIDTGTQHLASDDVEEQAAGDDHAAMFAELIARLPEAQQQVVRLTFYNGLSQREIARETGLPLGTVKTRIELGVKKLRAAVTKLGSRDEWLLAAA
jgi:RNA polymerase sigma-70 factor, ECF subfamily